MAPPPTSRLVSLIFSFLRARQAQLASLFHSFGTYDPLLSPSAPQYHVLEWKIMNWYQEVMETSRGVKQSSQRGERVPAHLCPSATKHPLSLLCIAPLSARGCLVSWESSLAPPGILLIVTNWGLKNLIWESCGGTAVLSLNCLPNGSVGSQTFH